MAIPEFISLYLNGINNDININNKLIIYPNILLSFKQRIYNYINGIKLNIFVISIIYFPTYFSYGFKKYNNAYGDINNVGYINILYILLFGSTKHIKGIII